MKFLLFIFLIFSKLVLSNHLVSHSLNDSVRYSVIYSLTYQPDSLDKKRILKEEFILLVGDSISYFSSLNFIKQETYISGLFTDFEKGKINGLNTSNMPKTGFTNKIYNLFSESKLIKLSTIGLDVYGINYSVPSWNIEATRDTLNGVVCNKASTFFGGRLYYAWFNVEMPIQEGPYIFKGLPGLITKIADSKGHYIWELKEISNIHQSDIPKYSTKGVKWITRLEMLKLTSPDARRSKLTELGAFDGNWVGIEKEEVQRRFEENLKRNNNPMELRE